MSSVGLLSGDADAIRSSAAGWSTFVDVASGAASDVRRIDSGDFLGDEADTYRARLSQDLPPHLDATAQAWSTVSGALRAYADALQGLQQRLTTLSIQAADQQSHVNSATTAVADAGTADARHVAAIAAEVKAMVPGNALPTDSYHAQTAAASSQLRAADAALQGTIDAANQVRSEHNAAVDFCVGAINAAAGTRFENPPSFWGRLRHGVGGWIRHHANVLTAVSGALKQVSGISGLLAMIPVLAPVMGPLAATTGAGSVVIDGAVRAATGRGSMRGVLIDAAGLLPGSRAVGGLVRGAKMVVEGKAAVGAARAAATLTGDARGVGAVAGRVGDVGAVRAVAADVGGAGGAVVGADRAGSRAVDSADSAVAHDTPAESLPCVGDPIDVVSGEMVLVQTDLELPGVLPLLLRRVYKSGYRWGGAFGRSWASTLDQRVELGSDGAACFVAEDGVVLHYRQTLDAATDIGVLPTEGVQRWPLRRDAGGGWTVTDPDNRITRRFSAADDRGRCALVEIADRHGNAIRFRYGDRGVVTEIEHSAGYRVQVASTGFLVTGLTVRGGPGDTVVASFGYDGSGNLVRVGDSGGAPLTLEWASGRIVGWRDRNDIWYRYDYDEAGRCVRTSGRGRVLSYGFCYLPGRTLVTNSLGDVSTYEYNHAHQVTRTIDPLGNVTASVWDRYDRLLLRTDPLGDSTQLEYDDAGALVGMDHPGGAREVLQRNASGQVVRVVGPTGAAWTHTYDAAGNVASTTDPLGAVTYCSYSANGAVAAVTDPLGAVTTVRSNPAGLPVELTDPLGATTRLDYDDMGRPVSCGDPAGGLTTWGWTGQGKLSYRVGPDGAREEWTWDGEGNLTSHVDPTGAATQVENGVFDLPVARTDPRGGRMLFGYDTELRLISVQNPAGLRWRYDYDAAGRLVAETDFNGRMQQYRHDAAGRVVGVVNGLGQHTGLVYNTAGHLVERTTDDGVTRLTYDLAGRLLVADSPGAAASLDRDACGRVVRETVNGASVTVEFDAAGRRVSRQTPAGVTTRWQLDAAGRPETMNTAGEQIAFEYDSAGREVGRSFAAGGRLEQRFDDAHRLVSQVMRGVDPLGAPSVGRAFSYRVDGALAGVLDTLSGAARRFDLDAAGRVVGVRAAGWTERYAYDPSGNLTHATAGAVDRPGGASVGLVGAGESAGGGGRKYAGTLVTRAGDVRYGHDRQGRMTVRSRRRLSRRPETWQFEYDADDRMVSATSNGRRWAYTYDPFGRRISKQLLRPDGTVVERIRFIWDGDHLIEQVHTTVERGQPTVTTWDYLPGSWSPVSQTVDPGDVDAQFYAIVTDLVGTPTDLVTPDGRRVAWTNADADLWGAPRRWKAANASSKYGIAQVACPIGFPGQYLDDETGLHYNRHRYYDPESARYTTGDPLGLVPADDPHSYVLNPTGWADPLGLTPCDPADLLGHEASGGHTIARHVGKSDEYLKGRKIPVASTFPDLATASREISSNLQRNRGGIDFWLHHMRGDSAAFFGNLSAGAGRAYHKQLDMYIEPAQVVTALRRDSTRPDGYVIVSSFPVP